MRWPPPPRRFLLRRRRALARLVRSAALLVRPRKRRPRRGPRRTVAASPSARATGRLEVSRAARPRPSGARGGRPGASFRSTSTSRASRDARRRAGPAPRRCAGRRTDAARADALRGRRQDAADDQLLVGGDARHGRSPDRAGRATAGARFRRRRRSRGSRRARSRERGPLRLPRRGALAARAPGRLRPARPDSLGEPRDAGRGACATRSSPSTASDRTRRKGLLRILGRHDYLALDSWVRKQYRAASPRSARRRSTGAIARRYARFGDFRGLALWLELTREWHEGESPDWS